MTPFISISQDLQLSQYYSNSLYLNPALTGIGRCTKVITNYRNSYIMPAKAYVSYSIGINSYIRSINGGIGFYIISDKQGGGAFTRNSYNLTMSYHFRISSELKASFGMEYSYINHSMNNFSEIYPDMLDLVNGIGSTSEPSVNDKLSGLYASAGFFLYTKKYYGGFSVKNFGLMQISTGRYTVTQRYTFHAGAKFDIGSAAKRENQTKITPGLIFVYQQNMQLLGLGFYAERQSLIGGLWINQSFIPNFSGNYISFVAGFDKGRFNIGYSVDIPTNRTITTLGMTNEISIRIKLICEEKFKKDNTISCPTF